MALYLRRLKDRMHQKAFPPDDEVFVKAQAAYNAMHQLSVALHYATCKGGTVGKPPRDIGK